jgi:uncharacterized protein YndB with AHSA1/START domain
MKQQITVEIFVNAPIEKVWNFWNDPEHIKNWYFASDTWCAPRAENNLAVGGMFKIRMEAKDKSAGFDLEGTYTVIEKEKKIEYVLIGEDKRKVNIEFFAQKNGCRVVESFDPEHMNPHEMQKNGWQSILNNFKKYVEA